MAAILTTIPAAAASITITSGSGGGGVDNVLFNDGSLQHSGLFVQGNFNGDGAGFILRFTSTSGNLLLEADGGQANIFGQTGNDPLVNLRFQLEGGATFNRAVLNPIATADGQVRFSVAYMLGDGLTPFIEDHTVDSNGNNFFNIVASGTARIVSVSLTGLDTSFEEVKQIRIGGFAREGQLPNVPEPATLLLVGSALAAGAWRRRKI